MLKMFSSALQRATLFLQLALVAFAVVVLNGCAAAGKPAAEAFARGVDRHYCKESEAQRAVYREGINEALAEYGHEFDGRLWCNGDDREGER